MRTLGLGLLALAALLAAQVVRPTYSKGEAECRRLVKAFGMPVIFGRIVERRHADSTTLSWGDCSCTYDKEGQVRSINDFSKAAQESGSKPIWKAPAEVGKAAAARLKSAGISLATPYGFAPKTPWPPSTAVVEVSGLAKANGYPTNGFAGGPKLQLNRYSGKVAGFVWSKPLKPEPPNVRLKKEQALKIAGPHLARLRRAGPAYSETAALQYMGVSPRGTPTARQLYDQGILPFCWVVTLNMLDRPGGRPVSPLAVVAIKADSGEVLSFPRA